MGNVRGAIHNEARNSQPRDFSKLRYANNITPTDVDCILEFGDKAYVMIEAKSNGAPVPYGQRLALQRMIRDWVLRGKKAILIIATHDYPVDVPIDFSQAKAVEHYDGRSWSRQMRHWKMKPLIDHWLQQNGLSEFIPKNFS